MILTIYIFISTFIINILRSKGGFTGIYTEYLSHIKETKDIIFCLKDGKTDG